MPNFPKTGTCICITHSIVGGLQKQKGKPEHYLDDYGVQWNRSGVDKDIRVIESPLFPDPDEPFHYTLPVLDENRLRKEYKDMLATREQCGQLK